MLSTTSSSGSVMWTRSAPATASAGDRATRAPNGSSARAFDSVRFQTVTVSPRRSIASTMPLPSRPVPMYATFAISILPIQSIAVRRFVRHWAERARPLQVSDVMNLACWLLAAAAIGARGTPSLRPAEDYRRLAPIFATAYASEQPEQAPVLRWAGDPEGGAPFVEADPSHPDTLVGFDVEIADLFARGLHRRAEFLNVTFTSIDQSIARGDADVGLRGIEDTPARRATLAVTIPYYEFREVLSVRDRDAARFRTLADLRGHSVATLGGTIAYEILLRAERQYGIQAISYEDDVHPYSALVIGRVDAVLLDNVSGDP